MRLGMGLGLGNLLSGGPITGMSNKYSFNFDGSNDYLDCGADVHDFSSGDFTILGWIYHDTGNTDHAGIVGIRSGGSTEVQFYIRAGGGDDDKLASWNGSGNVYSTSTISNNTWTHVGLVQSGGDKKFYINGILDNTASQGHGSADSSSFKIGYTGFGNEYFKGKIDEVAIWNTALSASDIAKIASKPVDFSKASSYDTDRTSNLKLWLRAGDKVLPEEDTSIARSDFYTDFDGADDIINCGSDSSLDNIWDGGGTLTGWIYPNSDGEGDDGRIAEKRDDGNGWTFVVREESSGSCKLRLFINYSTTNGIYTTDADVTIGAWNHVALTYDSSGAGSSYRPTFYVNGVVSALSATTDSAGTADSDASEDLTIGGNKTPLDRCFDGGISNLTLHQTILDAQTIKQFAKSRFTPMRNNRFSVVDFDGSNDYIDCGNDSSLQITGALTISTWLNQGAISDGSETVIYSKGDQGSARGVVLSIFRLDSSGGYTGFFALSSNGTSYAIISSIAYGVLDNYIGEWIHISATYDGAGNTKIYLNGTLQDSDSTSSFTINNSSQNAFVGSDGSASRTYEGSISSLAVYNTAKSAEEIYAIYQQGITYDESSLSGLVGYWRMGDDTSKAYPTIADSSSNSNDGTITNGASDDIQQQMVAGYDLGAFESSSEELGGSELANASSGNFVGVSSNDWTEEANGDITFSNNQMVVEKTGSGTNIIIADSGFFKTSTMPQKFLKITADVDSSTTGTWYFRSMFGSATAGIFDTPETDLTAGQTMSAYGLMDNTGAKLRLYGTGSIGTKLVLNSFEVKEVLQSEVSDTFPFIADVTEPVLGVEVASNNFGGWTLNGWTDNGDGTATINNTSGTTKDLTLSYSFTGTRVYKISVTFASISGTMGLSMADTGGIDKTVTTNGEQIVYIRTPDAGAGTFFIRSNDSSSATISNVSIKSVEGNVGTMTNQDSADLVYSSVLPDQSFLTGVNSAYNYIDLDGTDAYIPISVIALGDAFTLSAWVYFDVDASSGDFDYIISLGASGTRTHFSLGRFQDGTFYYYDGSGSKQSTSFTFSTGTWTHVLATVQPTSNRVKLYINGEEQAVAQPDGDFNISSSTGAIGRYQVSSTHYLNGRINNVSIINKTISSADASSIYNLGRHGNLLDSYSDSLVNYYAFGALDAVTGFADTDSTIYDRSGNSNHITPSGTATGDLKSPPNAEPNGYAKGDTNRSTDVK